jgi:hypothetical protein
VDDKEIRDLDYEFIQEFSFWLRSVKRCNHNSTVKYLTDFKKVVLNRVRKGRLSGDLFLKFKIARNAKRTFHSV